MAKMCECENCGKLFREDNPKAYFDKGSPICPECAPAFRVYECDRCGRDVYETDEGAIVTATTALCPECAKLDE